jgi:hypothetical protein
MMRQFHNFENDASLCRLDNIGANVGRTVPFSRASTKTTRSADGKVVEVGNGMPAVRDAANLAIIHTRNTDARKADCQTISAGARDADDIAATLPAYMKNLGIRNVLEFDADNEFFYHAGGTRDTADSPLGGWYMHSAFIKISDGTPPEVATNTGSSDGHFVFAVVGGLSNGKTRYGRQYIGDGWWRCWITARNDGNGTDGFLVYPAHITYLNGAKVYYAGGMVENVTHRYDPGRADGTLKPSPYVRLTDEVQELKYFYHGSSEGLHLNKSCTNLITYSNDISNAAWSKSSSVVVADGADAPDGRVIAGGDSAGAYELQDNNDAGNGAVAVISPSVTVLATTTYVYSAWVLPGSQDWAALAALNFTSPANSWAWFDITNGTVGTKDAGLDTSGMELWTIDGVDWYRCWITFTTGGADLNGNVGVYLCDADNDIVVARNGTQSMFIWGNQLEQEKYAVQDGPSPIVHTSGAAAARVQDVAYDTNAEYDNMKSPYASWFAKWHADYDCGQALSIMTHGASVYYNTISVDQTGSRTGEVYALHRNGSGGQDVADSPTTSVPFGETHSAAFRLRKDAGDFLLGCYYDGIEGVQDTTETSDAAPLSDGNFNVWAIASTAADNNYFGTIAWVGYLDEDIGYGQAMELSTGNVDPQSYGSEGGVMQRKKRRDRYRRR